MGLKMQWHKNSEIFLERKTATSRRHNPLQNTSICPNYILPFPPPEEETTMFSLRKRFGHNAMIHFAQLHFPGEIFFSQEVWSFLSLFPDLLVYPTGKASSLCWKNLCPPCVPGQKSPSGIRLICSSSVFPARCSTGGQGCPHNSWGPWGTCMEAAVPLPVTPAAGTLLFAEALECSSASCTPLDASQWTGRGLLTAGWH